MRFLLPNCIGLSCKTQEIYLLVFLMRYADLFMYFVSVYNTLMKIFFISSTSFIIYMIRFKKPYCTVSIVILDFLFFKIWLFVSHYPIFFKFCYMCHFSEYLKRYCNVSFANLKELQF